jgi:prepilin-type processing-associated H-X9-DG protein
MGFMMYVQDNDEKYPVQNSAAPANYADIIILNQPYDANSKNWIVAIYPYVKNWQLFKCPSSLNFKTAANTPGVGGVPKPNSNTGYAANGVLIENHTNGPRSMALIPKPAEIVLVHEFYDAYNYALIRPNRVSGESLYRYWNYKGTTTPGVNELHFEGGNQAFADGHVKWRKQSDICAADYGLDAVPAGPSANDCGPASPNDTKASPVAPFTP